eukprot:852260-Prymnesium_polylepis.2
MSLREVVHHARTQLPQIGAAHAACAPSRGGLAAMLLTRGGCTTVRRLSQLHEQERDHQCVHCCRHREVSCEA